MLTTSFETDTWECQNVDDIDAYCPDYGFNVCPSNNTVEPPYPPGASIPNPLGNCHCDGELWVAEGCAYGFFCEEAMPNGGKYIACEDVRTIMYNFCNTYYKHIKPLHQDIK